MKFLFLLAFFCHGPPGLATTVYKSMDEPGAVSFSDTLPEDSPAIETFEITIHEAASTDSTELLEEMRQTTDRMAADRRERDDHGTLQGQKTAGRAGLARHRADGAGRPRSARLVRDRLERRQRSRNLGRDDEGREHGRHADEPQELVD